MRQQIVVHEHAACPIGDDGNYCHGDELLETPKENAQEDALRPQLGQERHQGTADEEVEGQARAHDEAGEPAAG